MNMQVVLDTAFLGAGGFYERKQNTAKIVFFTGPGSQLGDN